MRKSIELKLAESSKYVLVESLRTTKKIYVNLKKLIRAFFLKQQKAKKNVFYSKISNYRRNIICENGRNAEHCVSSKIRIAKNVLYPKVLVVEKTKLRKKISFCQQKRQTKDQNGLFVNLS